MRGRYMVLGCVLLATGLVGTARAQVRTLTGSSFSVDDAGMVRTLEVATDEIAVRRSGGTCTVEKVGPFADAESIRRSALARKRLADEDGTVRNAGAKETFAQAIDAHQVILRRAVGLQPLGG